MQFDKRILHDVSSAIPITAEKPCGITRQRTFEICLCRFYQFAWRNFHDMEWEGGHKCDDYTAKNEPPENFLEKTVENYS